MNALHFDEALEAMMELTRAGNGYAESQAPWSLNRAGEQDRVREVLAAMAETCRILGHLVAPFTPLPPPGSPASWAFPSHMTSAVPAVRASRRSWHGAGDRMRWQTGAAEPLFPRAELPVAEEAAP